MCHGTRFAVEGLSEVFHYETAAIGVKIMSDRNKEILLQGNAAIAAGNYEAFVSICTEDTEWTFIGDQVLKGKEAVRQWMLQTYIEPPKVTVVHLIAEGDFLVATGEVTVKDKEGKETRTSYCDIWRFRGEKLVELRAFVVQATG